MRTIGRMRAEVPTRSSLRTLKAKMRLKPVTERPMQPEMTCRWKVAEESLPGLTSAAVTATCPHLSAHPLPHLRVANHPSTMPRSLSRLPTETWLSSVRSPKETTLMSHSSKTFLSNNRSRRRARLEPRLSSIQKCSQKTLKMFAHKLFLDLLSSRLPSNRLVRLNLRVVVSTTRMRGSLL